MTKTGVERIVERQMRNWELARSQRDAEPAAGAKPIFEFIAISRQAYGGGHTLARELGERNGWDVYDQEILNYMAQNDAVQATIYELADEHAEGHFESFLKNLGFEGQPPGADYFRKLVSSIHAIAQTNHAIFVGRGAGFILPAERGLSVRVVAPERTRFERYAEQAGCPAGKAAAAVRQRDAAREEFIREHFRVDASSPEQYDVVVNTGTLSTAAVAALVLAGLERKTNIRVAPAG